MIKKGDFVYWKSGFSEQGTVWAEGSIWLVKKVSHREIFTLEMVSPPILRENQKRMWETRTWSNVSRPDPMVKI